MDLRSKINEIMTNSAPFEKLGVQEGGDRFAQTQGFDINQARQAWDQFFANLNLTTDEQKQTYLMSHPDVYSKYLEALAMKEQAQQNPAMNQNAAQLDQIEQEIAQLGSSNPTRVQQLKEQYNKISRSADNKKRRLRQIVQDRLDREDRHEPKDDTPALEKMKKWRPIDPNSDRKLPPKELRIAKRKIIASSLPKALVDELTLILNDPSQKREERAEVYRFLKHSGLEPTKNPRGTWTVIDPTQRSRFAQLENPDITPTQLDEEIPEEMDDPKDLLDRISALIDAMEGENDPEISEIALKLVQRLENAIKEPFSEQEAEARAYDAECENCGPQDNKNPVMNPRTASLKINEIPNTEDFLASKNTTQLMSALHQADEALIKEPHNQRLHVAKQHLIKALEKHGIRIP